MENKKQPLRQCVACREKKSKKDLIRIVKLANSDEYVLDPTNKLNGRGAYICNDQKCIDLAVNKKLINRSFKTNISSELYNKLKEQKID